MSETKIIIPGRLKSGVVGGHVTGAEDVYDDAKEQDQASINAANDSSIRDINSTIGSDSTAGTVKGRIKTLEDEVGTGGSVDTRIEAAINSLDSSKSSTSSDGKVSVLVEETNGKLSGITVTTDDVASASIVAQNKQILDNDIAGINAKIPSAASSSNQLADKDFVNSSISTSTASFKGTYNSLAELEAVTGADNNDYGFVISTDASGNTLYNRYKYNGNSWVFEYALNNSSFTSGQWETINSGMLSSDKAKLDALPDNVTLTEALNSKQPNIADLDTIRSGAASGATAYQKPLSGIPLSDIEEATQQKINLGYTAYQKPSDGIPSSDMSEAVNASLAKAGTAYQKPSAGIPESDLDGATKNKIDRGNDAYQLPSTGIPKSTLSGDVQESLSKADTALQEHQSLEDYYTKETTDSLLSGKQDSLTIDDAPTEGSGNPISSGAVYSLQDTLNIAISGKQDNLTFDEIPTQGSNNPVKSKGIFQAIQNAGQLQFVEVTVLPSPSSATLGKIYIINNGTSYEWYVTIYDDTVDPTVYQWRQVNVGSVDLSDYYNKAEVDALLSAKQDTLVFATVEQAEAAANELT